jgi:lipopolysaccharide biosynthesis glycosyltransferase
VKIVEKKTLSEDNKEVRKKAKWMTAKRKAEIAQEKALEKALEKARKLTVYIGWDSREPIAADVCKYSILAHASIPVKIVYLKQDELRSKDIYTRPVDELGSTEFTFTRFLTPSLNQFSGWAMFVDCDFVFTDDVGKLLKIAQADPDKAVHVVQHDYQPTETTKMDGQQQHLYPRKNWSSMIMFNCEHPGVQKLDKTVVNRESGAYLHRFEWLNDRAIGNLEPEWNWLVGWYKEPDNGQPKALHYTLGGPWFEEYENCEYADVWNRYRDLMTSKKTDEVYTWDMITVENQFKQAMQDYFTMRYDPYKLFHNLDEKLVMAKLKIPKKPGVIAVLDGDEELEDIKLKNDAILENFVIGANGAVGRMDILANTPKSVPIVLRSIAKRKVMKKCRDAGRDYYYVDTGYFGNDKRKHFHRVTKNAMQWLGDLDPNCAEDRFLRTQTSIKGHTSGNDILICPPSEKAMKYWSMDVDTWIEETIAGIKERTDRNIVIRKKGTRTERTTVDTMEMALSRNVHCMVTFNSIAALESLIHGKPVFVLGPSGTNAAEPLANTDLDKIDDPWMPSFDQVRNLCCNLAYHQFTVAEFRNGTAWAMLNGTV